MTRALADLLGQLEGRQAFVCEPFTDADEMDGPRFRQHLSKLTH